MKIYFCCSVRGVRNNPETLKLLTDHLKGWGTVLTEHLAHVTEEFEAGISEAEIFQRDVAWLNEADVVVAEVTGPSLGVGYEIGIAETMGKPVLCLHRDTGKKISAMILGNPGLTVKSYGELSEAYEQIDEFLSFI
ncbi:MAG TPA: nucleoside 2-deoxyribosyltransferase [Patescibacteria group bacterium]|nr:nucleoside 2-deoxyribosyltransferase [Patescibacteria group bacterium]